MASKEGTVLELNYIGRDYCPINEFVCLSQEIPNGIKKEKDDSVRERIRGIFWNEVLLKSFIKVEKRLQSKNNEIYVCCGLDREASSKGPISVFMDGDESEPEDHTVYSKINGVVGALSISYDKESLDNLKSTIEGRPLYINYSKVIVNIRIISRFDFNKDNTKDIRSYFTATLLSYGRINKYIGTVNYDTDCLFDFLLIDILARRLEEAYTKGPYKTYRQFLGNDDHLRGSIDVARHIKLNAGMQNGSIAYRYKENTVNNYLNVLIMKAFQYAKRKYPTIVDLKIGNNVVLNDFFSQMNYEVDSQSISVHTAITQNLTPISHPFFYEYEEVRKVCLQILRNEGVSVFDLKIQDVSGFLYYIPDLWEDYLEHLFKRCFINTNLFIKSQYEQGFISDGIGTDDNMRYLCISKPDFIIENRGDNSKIILDAKMIPGMKAIMNNDIRYVQKDHSQAIDKCIRDMEVHGALGTGVIFPVNLSTEIYDKEREEFELDLETSLYSNCERRISADSERRFFAVPFAVPDAGRYKTYHLWKQEFDKCERVYTRIIRRLLSIDD